MCENRNLTHLNVLAQNLLRGICFSVNILHSSQTLVSLEFPSIVFLKEYLYVQNSQKLLD